MTKTLSDYRAETLILLGDPAGRRYSETTLDTAIRQALEMMKKYLPDKETIRGLDGSQTTTVPEELFLAVCMGTAGYALQIRARSVTEVFGKRTEDTAHLMEQGRHLETEFLAALDFAAFEASIPRNPWPGPGFPI